MRSSFRTVVAAGALVFFLLAVAAGATESTPAPQTDDQAALSGDRAGEQINWQVISSGGTQGSTTNFQLNGTVGQPIVGGGTTANYGLTHGFWQDFATSQTCCTMRGDVDASTTTNVADLTFLVNYLFKAGPEPYCPEHGDVDASASINVADLTYLVNYLFKGGPVPVACP